MNEKYFGGKFQNVEARDDITSAYPVELTTPVESPWLPERDADRGEEGILRYRQQFDDGTECLIVMVTVTTEGKPDWGWMLLETVPDLESSGVPLNFEFGFDTWEAAAAHFTKWVADNQIEPTESGATAP